MQVPITPVNGERAHGDLYINSLSMLSEFNSIKTTNIYIFYYAVYILNHGSYENLHPKIY